jgi:transposase
MSDRFDITLERKLECSGDEADGVSRVRRIELITGTGRRRRWSDDDKARIVVESFTPSANVSEVARRNGLSPQQLFAWRREAQALFNDDTATASGNDAAPGDTPVFAPVVIAAAEPASPSSPSRPPDPGMIEITIGDVVVRVTGHVETSSLIAILRALRRSS